jgi:hypothetical protein
MASPKHMKGTGSILTLFLDGAKQRPLDVESWSIKPVKVQVADAVCGERRDRLDSLVRHYMLSLKCFNETAAKLVMLTGYDESSDTNSIEDVALALRLTDRRNGHTLWSLLDAVIDDWNWACGGQKENQMVDIPIRGTEFKRV